MPQEKVIVTSAVTGSAHFSSMSPFLPITPQQIIEDAVKSAEAGAAVLHIHVRNPENGMPTPDIEIFRRNYRRHKTADKRCSMYLYWRRDGNE